MIIDYSQLEQLTKKNLDLHVVKESVLASKSRLSSIEKDFIPEVSLYAKTENDKLNKLGKEKSTGLLVYFNLFNGFKDIEKNRLSKLDYEFLKLNEQKTYNDLIFLAKSDYWQALKTQDYIKTLAEYQAINSSQTNLILKKVQSGLIPKSEELTAKKVDMTISEEMVKAEDELAILKSDLRKLLSIEKDEPISFKGAIDTDIVTLKLPTKKIDMAMVEIEEDRGESLKKMGSLWRMPKIFFYFDQSFSDLRDGEILDKDDNKPRVFGLKMILPLISEKNNESIEEQTRKREYDALVLKRKAKLIERENEDEKRLIAINYLKNSIERSKNKVSLSKEILSKITSEFKAGLKDASAINDSAEKYIEAKKDLLEHQIQYILALEQTHLNNLE